MKMSSPLILLLIMAGVMVASAGNFYQEVDVTWGDGRGKILEGGRSLSLNLDNYSGSGFQSKNMYLFGKFEMKLMLVPDNSAGTVTTFFLASEGPEHDEIDFEFLGNASGQPYTVHTNVYSKGKGNKEQQFQLWFDPTKAYHTYTIVWNPQKIIFLVDNIALRVFNNHKNLGIPFPESKPMRVLCSLWNADDWATQGGRVKTDWTKAPFTAYYRAVNFDGHACAKTASGLSCNSKSTSGSETPAWKTQELDGNARNRLRWVQSKHMIYNYCADKNRFPQGISTECSKSKF